MAVLTRACPFGTLLPRAGSNRRGALAIPEGEQSSLDFGTATSAAGAGRHRR